MSPRATDMNSTVRWAASPSRPAARAKMEVAMPPGADGVDPDAVLAELVRRRPRQVGDGRLARAVVVAGVVGGEPGHAGGVDDAAVSLGSHDPGRGPDAEEDAAQMDGDGAVEHRHVDVLDPAGRSGVAGVVEHAVEPAEGVDRRRHRGVDVVLLGDVGVHEAGPVPELVGDRACPGRRRRRPRRPTAPSATKSRAVASPMPDAPPVMTARRPSSRPMAQALWRWW